MPGACDRLLSRASSAFSAATTALGRPGGARKHKKGIEPHGHRWATYSVSKVQLTGNGPYRAVIQLKAAMVPVNLLNEIRDVGFDYNMSTRDVARNLVHGPVEGVDGHQVIWEREVTLEIGMDAKSK